MKSSNKQDETSYLFDEHDGEEPMAGLIIEVIEKQIKKKVDLQMGQDVYLKILKFKISPRHPQGPKG